ncbi:S8 family peptidase [Rhizocola hellebori]|nr:S8 family serine peptidase [Rhizocola hellebori]
MLAIVLALTGPAVAEPEAAQAGQTTAQATQTAAQAIIRTSIAPGSYAITLITGDKATLSVGIDRRIQVKLEPAVRADGSIPSITWYSTGEGIHAIPADVQERIDDGELDEKLFDLQYLVENKYHNEGALPLIVEYRGAVKPLAAAATTTPLRSVKAAATVTVDKGRAKEFWNGLAKKSTARVAAAEAPLAEGVKKIWLDRVAKVVLDQSVPQINAPQAWQAGYTGAGAKVAILDSGIDATHPDLAGKVIASRSFVDGVAEAIDDHGHGTHVASTIAGTGAASTGRYKGVAPDASLIIGKVCDSGGSCRDSDIIAGMEWAAIEQGADVISLSLGGCCSDGTDPMSQVVNTLTAQTGALFVIAAGNDGSGPGTIGAPGAADAALTVGAVSKTDQLAGFSSRGPRSGDSAIKPEITAPGVDIVAARAAGTSMGTPVGASYTTASGTSMATPHVSGAAALLVQQHPEWTGPQLKAALMSTARDGGYTVYEQGAGRVDAGRASRQQVLVTTPIADFGLLAVPGDGTMARTLTYSNPTSAPVTLDLTPSIRKADGTAVPAGTLTVDSQSVTIPAGATASIGATLTHNGLAAGLYTGSVVATNAAADLRLTIPVGLTIGDFKHRLRVTAVSRTCENGVLCIPGESAFWFNQMFVYRLGDADAKTGIRQAQPTRIALRPVTFPGESMVFEGEVAAGNYMIHWQPTWIASDDNQWQHPEIFAPEVLVTGPTDLSLDSNQAIKNEFKAPKPIGANRSAARLTTRLMGDGSIGAVTGTVYAYGDGNMWSLPSAPVKDGTVLTAFNGAFTAPDITMKVEGRGSFALNPLYPGMYPEGHQHFATPVRFPQGSRTLELVDVAYATAADTAKARLTGKLALMRIDPSCVLPPETLQRLKDAGAAGVVLNSDLCGVPIYMIPMPANADKPQIPYVTIGTAEAKRLTALLSSGPVRISLTSTPVSPYSFYLTDFTRGKAIPAKPVLRFEAKDLTTIEARYHSGRAASVNRVQFVWHSGEPMQINQTNEFNVPSTMTEYWSVDPQAEVWREVFGGDISTLVNRADVFTKPRRTTEDWNVEPIVPGAALRGVPRPDICAGCRDGDLFWPQMYWTGGDPAFTGGVVAYEFLLSPPPDMWKGLKLSRDGTEIPMTPYQGFLPAYRLPPDSGRYRLEMDASFYRNGTKTVWDFRSEGTANTDTVSGEYRCVRQDSPAGDYQGCRAEPLIFLNYDLGLSLGNTTPAPGAQLFEVTAYRQPSANASRIQGVKVWVSYDSGTKWIQALVVPKGDGKYAVAVLHPSAKHRASDTVSIKAEAWDADGNRVEQVIPRAFQLSERTSPRHRGGFVE